MSSSLLLLPAPGCTARRGGGAIRRSRAGRCVASADAPNEKVYVGKGKYIDAKPEGMPVRAPSETALYLSSAPPSFSSSHTLHPPMQGRDPGGFTGGWAGGEKGLKEGSWAAGWKEGEDPAQAPPSAKAAPEAAQGTGKDTIYVGKGRFVRDDASRYPDKELGGLTGGWAGGEVGLKTNVDLFPVNTRVKVKARRKHRPRPRAPDRCSPLLLLAG